MKMFKPKTQFKRVSNYLLASTLRSVTLTVFTLLQIIQTDGFTCSEMLEGRPWSYQTDIFCIAGTVHVMLFGEYMQTIRKFGQNEIKQKLPR